MTYFRHLLTLLLVMTCLHVSANAAPADDVSNNLPSITFASGSTTLTNGQTVPNGTLIKLQTVNFPEDAVFRYLIGAQAAEESDFENTKSKGDKVGLIGNAPLSYQHGIPVFASYTATGSPTVLSVQVSKTDKKGKTYSPYDGYSDIYTLTLTIDGTTAPVTPPSISPKTNDQDGSGNDPNTNTILTLSESSVTTGAAGNTVFAKYSNSHTYTPLQLMAEPNLQLGEHGAGTIGIFSTQTNKSRRTTALQVQHNVNYGGKTYDVASDVTVVYYWYTSDRNKAVLKATPSSIETTAADIEGGKPSQQLSVKFYNANDQNTPLDTTKLVDYQTKKQVAYTYECNNPEIASVDDNGLVTFTGKAGRAYVTITSSQVNIFDKNNSTTNNGYDAASVKVMLTVTDPRQMMPPIILPDGKKFYKDFTATVTANTSTTAEINGDAYYVVVTDGSKPKAEDIVKNGTRVPLGQTGEVKMSKQDATIYAVSYNPNLTNNKYSAISAETYIYLPLTEPILTPGNKGSIYWFLGTTLPVTASTNTPDANVYYTINTEGDITDISKAKLYTGGKTIPVKSGDVVRAVTYLDGVYSNTVTYTYKAQEGGSWRSYSSTSDRVFREGIQAYIITGYDKSQNAFTAKGIDVGATGTTYLPAYTGVLLYSNAMTQKQLLGDGIDGNGISIAGTGGRKSKPDLSQNMLKASDKDFKPHMSTYDADGNVNMAFNRWKDCPKYDGTDDYYGFFSFYENNTRDNQNNWRHTAYLQLPKGSEECIYFRNKEVESAKIIIFDDEPTAIRTLQETDEKADSPYYTLSGVQVAQPTAPGIYIHNGRKIIIKK